MKIKYLLPAIVLLISAPVYASQCPMDMKRIDQALQQQHGLSAQQVSEIRQLRDEGEKLHKTGQHQQSVSTLAKALAILGEK
ncbi:hypothetical protein [Sedimenticola hydrogenitrophicus]|uniref:hypothetical protein n=1 Tax=Sedimenticola hydrogenitrophicus TaxID=2967975 RepID=UPI0021A7D369|nr:hypothetical protein [Sedimenticola hydrogenitrophicus]